MALKRLIARIARQGGGKLLDKAIERLFPESPSPRSTATPSTAKADAPAAAPARKSSLTSKAANVALASLARRSVPAAIVIGGGILAKRLYDKRRTKGDGGNDQP